jgi:hypothetical protein
MRGTEMRSREIYRGYDILHKDRYTFIVSLNGVWQFDEVTLHAAYKEIDRRKKEQNRGEE